MNMSLRTIELDLPQAARPSRLTGLWSALQALVRALANRREANRLADLDDVQLADIGLCRTEVDRILRSTRLAEDPTRQLALAARERARRALPPF